MSKFHKKSCCVICKTEIATSALSKHFLAHSKKKETKPCLECKKEHNKSGIFCGSSCSGFYWGRNKDHSKRKPPKWYPKKPKQNTIFTKISNCIICNKFYNNNKPKQTCSKSCHKELLSRKTNERIMNGWNPNDNRGRSNMSYLEKSFVIWLESNFPNLEFIQEYLIRCKNTNVPYSVDFFFPIKNLIIELDGSQHSTQEAILHDRIRDSRISSEFGYKIYRISHKEYKNKTKVDFIKSLLGGAVEGS